MVFGLLYGFETCLARNTRRRNEKLISPADEIVDRALTVAASAICRGNLSTSSRSFAADRYHVGV